MANQNGSVGGVKDGFAVRRADGWSNSDTPSIGWLNGTPAAKSEVRGGPEVKIGPNSAVWGRGSNGPFMTGDQRGRKPR
jgi:hypothetical protein